jgi:hypothetical protein
MKFDIRLWRQRRNSFNDSAVVDGRLAMSSNFGPIAVFRGDVGSS